MAPASEPARPPPNGHVNGTAPAPSATPTTDLFAPLPTRPNAAPSRLAGLLDDDASPPSEAEDSAASTSPSGSPVTSPPYWLHAHSQQGHHRQAGPAGRRPLSSRARNVSAESVLPLGAITLRDNEADEAEAGDERGRNAACWAKSVQVTDYVVVNGSATNIGAFVVWNIRVETLSGSYMNIRKRYSEFDDFRERLVFSFPNFEAAVPVLPPKSVISRFRPRFLEKRRAGLQYFLNCIILNPEFSGSPVLKEFLFSQ